MPATNAIAAANEFLGFAEAENRPVDQMKLQKLLFYVRSGARRSRLGSK